MRLRPLVFPVIAISVFLYACKKKEAPPPGATSIAEDLAKPLDLSQAVTARPAAIVSVNAELDLEFDRDLVPPHLKGQTLDKNPFEFTPPIEGKAQWLDRNIIRFTPDAPLPAGRSFTGKFHGRVALGDQRNVNDYEFTFKVAEQEALDLDGDFVPDAEEGRTHYEGVLTMAQGADLEKLRRDISMEGPQGRVDVRVEAADAPNRARVVGASLARVQAGRNFRVTLPAEYTVNAGPWKREIFLPGKELFRVVAREEMTDPEDGELSYGFRFSEPVKEGMDLSGFVQVAPEAKFRVQIQGKYLKLKGAFAPGQNYTATISHGFPGAYGGKLPEDFRGEMAFTNRPPEVKWFSDGIFLPSENDFKLQIKSMNVAKLNVEVREIFSGNLGFFLQTNALGSGDSRSYSGYEDEEGGYSYQPGNFQDVERVGKTVFRKTFTLKSARNKWLKSELDLAKIFQGKKGQAYVMNLSFDQADLIGKCRNNVDSLADGDLFYAETGYYQNPCNDGYYYRNGKAQKLVLASNTALTVKKAEDGLHAFAVDVISAKPVSGLKLSLYSYQNQVMRSATTDGDGHVFFPVSEPKEGDSGKPDPDQPHYIRGDQDQGVAVLKIDHPPWETSRFDVDGVLGGQGGVDAFIYPDRGVRRPGDTIHLSAIFRINRRPPPENQPVLLTLLNARGQQVLETRAQTGPTGQVSFSLPTAGTDPTGTWTARLKLADRIFEEPLSVETVKPNRLKIHLDLPDRIVASPRGNTYVTGALETKYLFGAPAAGLKFTMDIRLTEKPKDFSRFPGFLFEHPFKHFPQDNVSIEDKVLDGGGRFALKQELPSLAKAPGGLEARIEVKVFEKGGGYTQQAKRIDVDPFAAYAGVKNPVEGSYARQGETYKLQVVSLDPSGKPLPGRRLKLRVYVNRHYWWWDYDGRDRKDFRTRPNTFLVEEQSLVSEAKPLTVKLKLEDEGEHLIEVKDEGSGHESGFFLYASQWGEQAVADKKERTYVEIGLDKNVYQLGDKGSLSFKSPGQGRALVCFEQGRRLLKSQWVDVKAGQTTVPFAVDAEMVPNFYATVSLIQPHNQAKNDLPMRLYGVKPVYVEDGGAKLAIKLDMPDEIRPQTEFIANVHSDAREAATFTIAIVDEGLLDLTGFETPSPLAYFFKKIALGLTTIDNFDDFMGALISDMDQYFTIGGDEEQRAKRAGSDNSRRFKPVALFQGPLTLAPGETKQVKFTMPNYVGSVRAMVVATSKIGFAARESTVPVRQPLMVLTTLPRVIAPGDKFQLPVSVFAMDSTLNAAKVTLELPKTMSAAGPAEQDLAFAKPGEADAAFSVDAGKALGWAKIKVAAEGTARGKTERTEDVTELNVRSPNPFYTRVRDTAATGGAAVTVVPEKVGLEGSNKAYIAFSRLPDLQVQKRMQDLIRYPYGCLEQTVSSVFPQLYLPSLADLKPDEQQAITDNVNAGIRKLADFALPGRGFSMWPMSSLYRFYYSDWATSYAAHFLLEAKALGYYVPPNLLNDWLEFAESEAKNVGDDHRYQTYRLFLLALAGRPNAGAMNLVRENYLKDLDALSRKLLAAAYYEAGKKTEAAAVEGQVTTELKTYRELGETYGSDLRDQALMAYLSMRMGQAKEGADRLNRVVKRFREDGWYSTQEMGVALMALGSYYRKFPFTGGARVFTMSVAGGAARKLELKAYQMKLPLDDAWGKKITVQAEGNDPLFITLMEEGVPLESTLKDASQGLQLTRNFYDEEGRTMGIDDVKKDRVFWVHYRVHNTSGQGLTGLALSSVFPAGWEIVSSRVGDEDDPEWVRNLGAWSGDYMDIRDDRVNWFFDLGDGATADFTAKLNPTFGGDYALPPVVVEAMYSPEFFGHLAGGRVQVK